MAQQDKDLAFSLCSSSGLVAAEAWVQPLAQELPYAVDTAINRKKKKKRKEYIKRGIEIDDEYQSIKCFTKTMT